MGGGSERSAAGSRAVALPLIVGVGLVYGLAEFVRQRWIAPSPLGIPGDGGGDLLAYVALGVSVVGVPAGIALLGARRRAFAPWLAWMLALTPTAALALMRVGTLRRANWAITPDHEPRWGLVVLLATLLGAAVATIVVMATRRLDLPRGLRAASIGLVVLAPLVLVGRLGVPAPPTSTRGDDAKPNVVLLTIDTLRADAVTHVTDAWPSEALDRRVVTNLWSNSSWTRPAMASFFSAVVPTGHGADDQRAPSAEVAWFVDDFRRAGYRTMAVVANPHLRRRFGFDRGFDLFEHFGELEWLEPIARSFWAEWWLERQGNERDQASADRLIPRAESMLESYGGDGPWLLWVHLVDPHVPYHLRGPEGARRHEDPGPWVDVLRPVLEDDAFHALWEAREGTAVTSAAERQALRRLYQTEVDFALHWSARLLRAAGEASGDRDLVWLMTSDHGEEFWENGGFEHGHTMHPTVTEVPLWIGGTRSVDGANAPRRLIDVGPWLLAQTGLNPMEPRAGAGLLDEDVALAPFALGSATRRSEVLAEGTLYGPPRTWLRWPDLTDVERDDAARSLRVRPADGDSAAARERAAGLLIQLDLWRERNALQGRDVELSPDLVRQLRAIGYVQ